MTAAPVVDERTHGDAVEALLTGPLNGHVYEYDDLPATLPNIFVLLSVERRYVPPSSFTGLTGRSGWRIAVRYVGRTVDEARWALNKVTQAVEQKRITVGGYTSTPVAHESSQAIALDDGRYSGVSLFTYAL